MKISGREKLERMGWVMAFTLLYIYVIRPLRALFSQKSYLSMADVRAKLDWECYQYSSSSP